MILDCGCKENEDGLVVEFCRACAAALPQRLDDGEANPGWLRARLGKLTSSGVTKALAKNRKGDGPGTTQLEYRAALVCERFSGEPYEGFHNSYMDRGNATEPEAIGAYKLFVRSDVRPVGFIHHPVIMEAGASPDSLVGEDGQLEVKCRKTHIHLDLLDTKQIPSADMNQVLFALACTGRLWCDYVSYDPRAPVGCDLFVKRIFRDDHTARIAEIEERGQEFLAEVEKQTKELQERSLSGFIFLEREQNGDGLLTQLAGSVEILKSPSVVVPIGRRARTKKGSYK